jgi:hypothetical protein
MMSKSDLIMTVQFLNYPRWHDRHSIKLLDIMSHLICSPFTRDEQRSSVGVLLTVVKCNFYAVNSCINKWNLNIHTRIGIIYDKFHECRWIFEYRCFSSLNERKHTLWIQATQHQSMRGYHVGFTWIHGPTKQKNTTPANQERAHRSKGPPEEARTSRTGPRAL